MSRTTRKMLLVAIVAGVLPFAMAALVHAGPSACANCSEAINDVNADGKTDYVLEQTSGNNPGIVKVVALDNTNAPLNRNFPAKMSAVIALNGAGHVSATVGPGGSPQAWLVARNISGGNQGLLRSVKLNAVNLAPAGKVFPGMANADYSLVGTADADGNGSGDYFFLKVTGTNPGLVKIILTNPDGSLLSGSNFPGTLSANQSVLAVGDMTGDNLADVLTLRSTDDTYVVEVMTKTGCVPPTQVCFGTAETPGVLGTDFDFLALAYNNLDDRMDVWERKKLTASPNPGLVKVRIVEAGAATFNATPAFPVLPGAGYDNLYSGNFDGLNQAGILGERADGSTRVWNLTEDGTGILAAGAGTNVSANYKVFPEVEPVLP